MSTKLITPLVLINRQSLGGTSKASIVAWGAPVQGQIDFLILYATERQDPTPPTLDAVLAAWSTADARSICFMDRVALQTVAEYTAAQLQQVFGNVRGRIIAFPGQDLTRTGGIPFYGDGATEELRISYNVLLQNVPSLDEMQLSGSTGAAVLKRKDAKPMVLLMGDDRKATDVPFLELDLNPPVPYLSGALRIPLAARALQDFCDQLVRVTFYAAGRNDTHGIYNLSAQQCRLIDEVKPAAAGTVCTAVLDLRESFGPWFSLTTKLLTSRWTNSRVEDFVSGLTFESTYRNDAGASVRLSVPQESAVESPPRFLLAQVHEYLEGDFAVPVPTSGVPVEFIPVGTFVLSSETRDGSGKFRLITGRHASDRLECQSGDFLEFQAGCPNILVDPLTKKTVLVTTPGIAPAASDFLHGASQNGLVHTSWARHRSSKPATYYCESKDDPLFDRIDSTPGPAPTSAGPAPTAAKDTPSVSLDLKRMNLPVGLATGIVMPMLPWGGTETSMDADLLAAFEAADSTHLAHVRQLQINSAPPTPAITAAPAGTRRGVTPQGLLADINGSNFANVYFGAAKDGELELVMTHIDPAEALSGPYPAKDAENRQKIQAALRASQSFFIAYTKAGLSRFSLRLKVDVFTFDVALPTTIDDQAATCVIVKLRTDRTLQDLLEHPSAWSCPEALNGENTDTPGQSNKMGGQILDYLKKPTGANPAVDRLDHVLNDKNWSGILLVKMLPSGLPDILEALRPGIVNSKFFVHHIGMDLLPARAVALASADAPKRFGQAFGLIQYSGTEAGTPPTAYDDTKYWFVVVTLEIGFSNGRVDYFACEVDIGSNRWFLDSLQNTDPTAGDTKVVKLLGSYASRVSNGQEITVFSLSTATTFVWNFANSFLQTVTLKQASFVVTNTDQTGGKSRPTRAQLLFNGELVFNPNNEFCRQLFVVKSLTFDGVGLGFDYSYAASGKTIAFKPSFVSGNSSWDIEPSPEATSTLLSLLPLKWTGFRFSLGAPTLLSNLGFASLLGPGQLSFHFAFELQLDLSGLGKLVGDFQSLKLPALLGWQKNGGGVCFGIQWPNINGRLDIGIEQFIHLHADQLAIDHCNAAGHTGIAIILRNLRLNILGQDIPSTNDKLDAFAFVNADDRGKLAWAFSYLPGGADDGSWFQIKKFGFAHRLSLPSTAGKSDSVRDIVDSYEIPAVSHSACEALSRWALNLGSDNWLFLGSLSIAKIINAWFLVDDSKPLYGLYVEIVENFGVGLLYQRLSADLGKFAGELDLRHLFPPLNFGAASVTLPVIGLEYDTDGGFRVDVGFPWNNDFSRSARVEMGIYMGAGGLYYGRVSAESLKDSILKVDRPGYVTLSDAEYKLYPHTVLVAGFAMELGYGKSFELGILSARIEITVFGSIEGAMGWKTTAQGDPQIWYIQGKVGINLYIEGSVDFVIITAKAVIHASIDVGITKKRILAKRAGDTSALAIGYLTCPTTLFVEAQLSVHAEATLEIGCVSVTLSFDFHATYSEKFELDGESFTAIGATPASTELQSARVPAWIDGFVLNDVRPQTPLEIIVAAVPTLAAPADMPDGTVDNDWVDTLVVQTLVSESAFQQMCKLFAGWAFQSTTGQDISQGPVRVEDVRKVRAFAANAANWEVSSAWVRIRSLVNNQFALSFKGLPDNPNQSLDGYLPIATWPEIAWKVRSLAADGSTLGEYAAAASSLDATWLGNKQKATAGQLPGSNQAPSIIARNLPAGAAQFVDYSRSLVRGLFGRVETVLMKSGAPSDVGSANRSISQMPWADIWTHLNSYS